MRVCARYGSALRESAPPVLYPHNVRREGTSRSRLHACGEVQPRRPQKREAGLAPRECHGGPSRGVAFAAAARLRSRRVLALRQHVAQLKAAQFRLLGLVRRGNIAAAMAGGRGGVPLRGLTRDDRGGRGGVRRAASRENGVSGSNGLLTCGLRNAGF